MKPISERQRLVLRFVQDFLDERSYPPTIRDIVSGCHLSSTSVADYNLKILEEEGYIRRAPDISRGIEVLSRSRARMLRVPIIGRIAAGEPIPVPAPDAWTVADTGEAVELPQEMVGSRDGVYALRVKGNSMIDALIGDGDVVLMRPAAAADNGEMVAVWLKAEKEVTLKKLFREQGRIRLQPANSRMKPIYADPDNVEIQGKVIGVIRNLG